MDSLTPLGTGAWLFIGVYLFSLIGIGFLALAARRENTMADFYLAGNGFGFTVLFLTLFATQYSGNTFFAFTGATYRIGYPWILSLHFMTAVVICYLIYAPKLYLLAKTKHYVTPSDYVQDRFQHRGLSLFVSIIMIVALCNFLLAQLMAMGRAMQGLSHANGDHAYIGGVIILALIMVVYGTLGGLRAVAWTDAIQGVTLAVGFLILFYLLLDYYGPIGEATSKLLHEDLATGSRKTRPPDSNTSRAWLSYIFTAGLAVSLYPQAIQRIYAAKSAAVLRRSLSVMVFMPLPTMIIAVTAGIMAAAYIPGLEAAAADQIFGRVLRDIQSHSEFGYGLVVVLLAAVLAAMMSTADSALLSISSMFTKDIYARYIKPDAAEKHLTLVGKLCSWALVTLLVALAILLRNQASLVAIMDRKLDLLVQLVPVFMLGVRWPGIRTGPCLAGLVIGVSIALIIPFAGFDFVVKGKIYGFHPGLIALVPNLFIAVLGSYCLPANPTKSRA